MKSFDNSANGRRKRNYRKHEKQVQKTLGGVGTIGSGNKGMKGDVWAGDPDAGQRLMVECKVTEADRIQLKLLWLEKLVKEARESGREPVLAIRLTHPDFGPLDFGLLPLDRYIELDYPQPVAEDQFFPDARITGKSITLTADWCRSEATDITVAVVHVTGPRRLGTPARWALLPLERLRALYAADALLRS